MDICISFALLFSLTDISALICWYADISCWLIYQYLILEQLIDANLKRTNHVVTVDIAQLLDQRPLYSFHVGTLFGASNARLVVTIEQDLFKLHCHYCLSRDL